MTLAFYPKVCSFLGFGRQLATNLPTPVRSKLLVWTTCPGAGSIQIRDGVLALKAGEVEPPDNNLSSARDTQDALEVSPTRAQHS